MLVVGAGLLGYSLVRLHETALGFDPKGLTMLPLEMSKQGREGKALIGFYKEFADDLSKVKGVDDVSYVGILPMSGRTGIGNVGTPGQPKHYFFMSQIGPRYFATVRTPLLAGREFRWTDTDESGRKAILNELGCPDSVSARTRNRATSVVRQSILRL